MNQHYLQLYADFIVKEMCIRDRFRRSPVHLPYIGANYNAVYPFRTSVLFTDSLPLEMCIRDSSQGLQYLPL